MENDSTALRRRITAELDELRRQNQFRTLDRPAGIDLLSNDYLGLARDPRLARALVEAVSASGRVGSGGSRLLGGNAEEWEQAESEFAEFAGVESSLYFSSGYAPVWIGFQYTPSSAATSSAERTVLPTFVSVPVTK